MSYQINHKEAQHYMNVFAEERAKDTQPFYGLGPEGRGFELTTLTPEIHQRLLDLRDKWRPYFTKEPVVTVHNCLDATKAGSSFYIEEKVLWDLAFEMKGQHEDWCGMELAPTSVYGLRVYHPGAYLYLHTDKYPTHIISSTICVSCDLDMPWPLYIEDQNQEGEFVDLQPGQQLLYEGARLLHGRMWPLIGREYVSLFIHYKPKGFKG